MQQRGFTGTGGTDDCRELTSLNLHRDMIESHDLRLVVAETPIQILGFNNCSHVVVPKGPAAKPGLGRCAKRNLLDIMLPLRSATPRKWGN